MHALDQYKHQINVRDCPGSCWRYWEKHNNRIDKNCCTLTNKCHFGLNPCTDTTENRRSIQVLSNAEQRSKDSIQYFFATLLPMNVTISSFDGNRSHGTSNTRNWWSSLFVSKQRPSGDLKDENNFIFVVRWRTLPVYHLHPFKKLFDRLGVCVGNWNSWFNISSGVWFVTAFRFSLVKRSIFY